MADEALRVVFLNRDGLWIAQCLEHDICVQATDLDEVKERLEMAMEFEVENAKSKGVEPYVRIPPAPKMFSDLWEGSQWEVNPQGEELRAGGRLVTARIASLGIAA